MSRDLTPGEGSPVWMRGWSAAVNACFEWLVVKEKRFKPASALHLDDQLERAGLLKPEARDAEEQLLHSLNRLLEAELAVRAAQIRVEKDRNAVLAGRLDEAGRLRPVL